MYGYPAKTIAKLSGPQPRTAREAKKCVRKHNEAARTRRAKEEAAHQARQRDLDALVEKNRAAAGSLARPARARGPRIDPSAVYRARAAGTKPEDEGKRPGHDTATTTPAPRQARTLAQVARDYYGSGDHGREPIPASPRGGAS
jgi:hypothetical protein